MKNNYQDVFKRYEKKYMLTAQQYARLMVRLENIISEDEYGLHTISNIYFDDDNFSLIRRSLEKPEYKEKLRMRLYGEPGDDADIFFEIKKKYGGVVYKRRAAMKLTEAVRYIATGESGGSGQIFNELDYAMKLYRPVPKMFIAYDRRAFYCNEDSELRITFDSKIRCRTVGLDFRAGNYGRGILDDGCVLMEVKIAGAAPFWLARIFSELGIFSSSFSKYGECYRLMQAEADIAGRRQAGNEGKAGERDGLGAPLIPTGISAAKNAETGGRIYA